MDFFSSQDVAKRNTTRLIVLFALAVISMVVLINLAVMIGLGFFNLESGEQVQIDWTIFFAIGFGVVTLIGLGSLYKIKSLSGGGDKIAQQMNGEIVFSDSSDFKRKRLHNIVEEMAIASGVPVPSVYIIRGSGINAFAAGHSYSDAVIGVSSGALEQLTRDELQGVIAHEFSHILNGDMRINIRLIGVLHGILLIGLIGSYLLRFTPRSRNSKGSGGFVVMGIGLVIVGYSGTFFGNLIKAAVNRQREYLADSAAVQFTRNPGGIAGALIRIGSTKNGSLIKQAGVEEISHALFSQGLTSLFATHPPLKKRIKRILPTWDGTFTPLTATPRPEKDTKSKQTPKEPFSKKDIGMVAAAGAAVIHGRKIVGQVGRLSQDNITSARQFIDTLPKKLTQAVHTPYGAQALLFSIVLDREENERRKQLLYLEATLDHGTYNEVTGLTTLVASLKSGQRLPVVDLALPSLRQLSSNQYQIFKEILMALIAADKKMSFFEWVLQKVVIHHLDGTFSNSARTITKEPSIRRAGEAGAILLSVFLNNMKQGGLSRQEVVDEIILNTRWLETNKLHNTEKISLKELDVALDDLVGLKPRFKKMLLEACATVVMADNQVSTQETELLRAIASSLNCPMPMTIST
jgi:Zn-dependent protease with chaperone function